MKIKTEIFIGLCVLTPVVTVLLLIAYSIVRALFPW